MDGLKSSGKPFDISKRQVWEAWEKVKANQGAPGVDRETLEAFEKDLTDNLYKIWNRMASGTYFPPAVRAVQIPKAGGGARVLGVPTVADRVAQTVAADHLMARVEPVFHEDSYGYRPGRSALDAVARCRERCWKRDWVVEFDIQKFFDSVPWDRMLKAVAAHADAAWVVLYVKRWLQAPLALPDGTVQERERGTPQGSAISPVLANLFMHYAFDMWLVREFPAVTFERYADDAVVHCATERQAGEVLAALQERMEQVGLRLHPDKTKIVYCADDERRGSYEHTQFTFLGYTFTARDARRRGGGGGFRSFQPAVSKAAMNRMGERVRALRLHRHTDIDLDTLARMLDPIVRGWMTYYGRFYRSALYPLLERINAYLVRWLREKYRRLAGLRKALAKWWQIVDRDPRLFAHWAWTSRPAPAW